MDELSFEVSLARLLATIREIVVLLTRHGECHWVATLEKAATELERGDGHGVLRLLGMCGGMGSFNDLVLCRLNHHKITAEQEAPANELLQVLIDDMLALANRLRRLADL